MLKKLIKYILHIVVSCHWYLIKIFDTFLMRKKVPEFPVTILLTGTFFSHNWILNHLTPLSLSTKIKKIILVTTFPINPINKKVTIKTPPQTLINLLGEVPSRLLYFMVCAFKDKPDVIGGFHLLLNGLLASFIARFIRAKSIYICGGGPREVLDGGIHASRLFSLIGSPDPVMEKKLLRAVTTFDAVVTMGPNAIKFFQRHGVKSNFVIIPGGIDRRKFRHDKTIQKEFDCIFVGRMDRVKRIDIYIDMVALLKKRFRTVSALIIGTGELKDELHALVEKRDLKKEILFLGYQADVVKWLNKSKLFFITSESEGLPLALMEAMSCALPCIASNVGEIGELLEHGKNGFLVDTRNPEEFAKYASKLLQDKNLYKTFSRNAELAAAKLDISHSAKRWDDMLINLVSTDRDKVAV